MIVTIVLVIMITTVNAADCPTSCECRTYPRDDPHTTTSANATHTTITCNATNLVNYNTYRFPDNTESLIFSEISNLELLLNSTQDLPHLTKLSITRSVLPDLFNISVRGLKGLRTFEIANCQIQHLPDLNLTSLQLLDVSNNKLKVIESEQFRTLQRLEVLNLSANALDRITSDGFVGLSNLKCLDISMNHLSSLNDRVLIPLTSLQHLNLSNNRLEVLNEACFSSLLYLQQLDVSWNRLARVAPGSLELPSLARLLLAGNPRLGSSREPTLLVGTGRRLQTVDASRTGLKQVPAVLTHSIRTLRLAGNSIRSVNRGDLDSYPLLQLLDFTSNELEIIEDDALGRLDSLTILYLTDNKLTSIPHSLSERLRVLHLENNQVARVQPADLLGLSNLEVLLLSRNKIAVIGEAAFGQLTALANLDLSYNPITALPSGSLTGPTQLRVLRLAGLLNVVSNAKEVEFPLPTPEHLITLDLSSSPSLARQMLADTAALAASRELQELNLATSGLSNIRTDLLHFLPQLRIIHLYDNPLNCSELQWLAEWMRRQNDPEYRRVVCMTPVELWGTLLVDLQNIEPETTTINQAERMGMAERENNSNNNKSTANVQTSYIPPKGNVEDNSLRTASRHTVTDDKVSTEPDLISTYTSIQAGVTTPQPETPTTTTFSTFPTHNITDKTKTLRYTNNTIKEKTTDINNTQTQANNHIRASIKPMNALIERKSQVRNVNNILKDVRSDGNLFMEKTLNKQESVLEKYDNTFQREEVSKVGVISSMSRSTSTTAATSTFLTTRGHTTHEDAAEVVAATGETMSMYSTGDKQLAHPGMFILAIGILGAVALLILFTTKMTRRHNQRRHSCGGASSLHEDIEVSSLPSVTELW